MASSIQNSFTSERAISFLNQSNHIEGIDQIDYHALEFQDPTKGHFGAYVASQQLALDRKPLDIKTIRVWQGMITREQKENGNPIEEEKIGHIRGPNLELNVRVGGHVPPHWTRVPLLLTCLVEDINEGLKHPKKIEDVVSYCQLLGSSFQRFEAIHPFGDGNGRIGRLIANYVASFMRRPIMVFGASESERSRYYKAHKSKNAMCQFMATKIKETVIGLSGDLLSKKETAHSSSSVYTNADQSQSEMVEWHDLDSAATTTWGPKAYLGG